MLYKYFQRNNAVSGRFVIIRATERENNGLKCKKDLETPSQGTCVLLSFKGLIFLDRRGQCLVVLESPLFIHRVGSAGFND